MFWKANLQIPAPEHAFIEDQGLGNQLWLRELDIGISGLLSDF